MSGLTKTTPIGEHKWSSCEEYASKVYTDNRVGQVWEQREDAGTLSERVEYRCDKCAKVFADPDDPSIAKEPHENGPPPVPPPVPGTEVRNKDGSLAGTVMLVIGRVSSAFPDVYEIVPNYRGADSMRASVVRRLKILVPNPGRENDRNPARRSSFRFCYVVCDRRTHEI